jgi:hypothetical protein
LPGFFDTPSGIKLVHSFTIEADRVSDLILDFDACKSIVRRGNGPLWAEADHQGSRGRQCRADRRQHRRLTEPHDLGAEERHGRAQHDDRRGRATLKRVTPA